MARLSSLLLAVALCAAMPASATTMVQLSQDELTYVADLIVEGVVESSDAERQAGGIWIHTVSTLRITRVLKGAGIEGDRVQVREWGGAILGEVTRMPSAPTYTAGERVIVFLERERRPDAMWRTLGMTQGKLTLIEEVDTGRDVVLPGVGPTGGAQFEEHKVRLPAVRRYSDAVIDAVVTQTTAGFVPPYTRIPGLPPDKDDAFRAAAEAAGQQVDPRWDVARARILSAATEGGER